MTVESRLGHRQRQAQATRDAVASAARQLFAERGYTSTTIEAISQAARVPSQTIYSAFGSKPAILEHIREMWVAETEVRELGARALTLPNPADRLRQAAHWTRRQFELGSDVITMYQEAARSDPRVAKTWAGVLRGRERAIREVLAPFAKQDSLDLYITLTLSEIYRSLVLERGWTPSRYETWLAQVLIQELLDHDTKRSTRRQTGRQRRAPG